MRALLHARMLWGRGELDAAEVRLEQALAESPGNARVHAELALVRIGQCRKSAAVQALESSLALDPGDGYARFVRSHLRLMEAPVFQLPLFGSVLMGDIAVRHAIRDVREALELDPAEPLYLRRLSELRGLQHRWREALAAADEALTLDPGSVPALALRAQALRFLGCRQESRQVLADTLRLDPEASAVHARLGWLLVEAGEDRPAENFFLEALRLDASSAWAQEGYLLCAKRRWRFYRWFSDLGFRIESIPMGRRLACFGLALVGFFGLVGFSDHLAKSHPAMAPVPGLLFAALLVSVVAAGLMDPVYGWRARRLPAAQSTFAVQERTRRKWTVGLVLVAVGVGLLVGALNHLDRRLGVGLVGLVPGLASLVLSIGIRDRKLRWAARGYAVVAAMVGVPVALWLEINELQPQGMAFCIALAVPILPVSLLMQWDDRRRAEAERQVVRQGMK